MDFDGNSRSVQIETSDIDTSAIVAIALSSDKAVLLYAQRVDYYRITGTGASAAGAESIERLFNRSFAKSIEAVVNTDSGCPASVLC